MRYRLLVTDLDDTLLKDDGTISKKNRRALRRFIERGGKVALASGRTEPTMEKVIKMVGLEDQKHIAHNGLSVFSLDGYRNIPEKLPHHEVERLLNLLKDNGIESNVFCPEGIYHNHSYELARVMDKYVHGFPVIDIDEMPVNQKDVFIVFGIMKSDYHTKLMRTWDDDIVESGEGNGFVFFMPRGTGKYTGVKVLAEEFGIDEDDIVCIGDGGNDVQMLREAKLGISVSNAHPEAKEVSDVILDRTNEEDAVAYVIEKYVFEEDDD